MSASAWSYSNGANNSSHSTINPQLKTATMLSKSSSHQLPPSTQTSHKTAAAMKSIFTAKSHTRLIAAAGTLSTDIPPLRHNTPAIHPMPLLWLLNHHFVLILGYIMSAAKPPRMPIAPPSRTATPRRSSSSPCWSPGFLQPSTASGPLLHLP